MYGGASYRSLQSKLEVRNLAGGTVLVAYTYGKCLTDGTYANQVREDNSTINYYGPCNYDLTHNFVTSYLYALPFGRGRTFGTHMNRVEDSLVGGWNLSGIATLQSGLPYTVSISGDQANTGAAGQRPKVVGKPKVIRSPNCWFTIQLIRHAPRLVARMLISHRRSTLTATVASIHCVRMDWYSSTSLC
jgi:hypothetical protein